MTNLKRSWKQELNKQESCCLDS